MTTEWRAVVGLEGYYEVSNTGLVRGVDRRVPHARFGSRLIRGRILKSQIHLGGYHYARMKKGGNEVGCMVHRAVLEAFVGPCPEGMEGCHNDGNPANNAITNLRWDTPSNNAFDNVRHGTHTQARKTRCPRGHAYDEENTARYNTRDGRFRRRRCRICDRQRARDYWRRARATQPQPGFVA